MGTSSPAKLGTLFLVATPIGNLQDISARAAETLRVVDIVACEDTRHTRKLLNHLGISAKTVSYHDHNESARSEELRNKLVGGLSVALVSDAGTPGINDPGSQLVRRAIEIGAVVVPIPGPTAFVSALVASGLPTDSVFFGGFLPSKKSDRRKRLMELGSIPATLVFYESPYRIAASLADCLDVLGDRDVAIARELTKVHEEFIRGKLSEIAGKYSTANPRGEFVLLIDRGQESDQKGSEMSDSDLVDRVKQLLETGLDRKAALKKAAKEFGLNRSEAYRIFHLQ